MALGFHFLGQQGQAEGSLPTLSRNPKHQIKRQHEKECGLANQFRTKEGNSSPIIESKGQKFFGLQDLMIEWWLELQYVINEVYDASKLKKGKFKKKKRRRRKGKSYQK